MLVCKRQYDHRMVVVPFGGEVEDVWKLAEQLDAHYLAMRERRAGT